MIDIRRHAQGLRTGSLMLLVSALNPGELIAPITIGHHPQSVSETRDRHTRICSSLGRDKPRGTILKVLSGLRNVKGNIPLMIALRGIGLVERR